MGIELFVYMQAQRRKKFARIGRVYICLVGHIQFCLLRVSRGRICILKLSTPTPSSYVWPQTMVLINLCIVHADIRIYCTYRCKYR